MDIHSVAGTQISARVLKSYEAALSKIDTPEFQGAVDAALSEVAPSVRFYVFDGEAEASKTLRMARIEPALEPLISLYLERYRPSDPIAEAVKALDSNDGAVLMRVAPDDIQQEGFRDRFFSAHDIVERVSLVQRTTTGWRALNISRNRDNGACSDDELSSFIGLGQLLLPMVFRNSERIPVASPSRGSVPELERRFAERRPSLSGRERQVCARAAIGMSVEATALDLGIEMTSVLTYRRRAYARLCVSSPYELAGLVMG